MGGFLFSVSVFAVLALSGFAFGIGSTAGRLLVYWVAG
jgi:hypothetical protein